MTLAEMFDQAARLEQAAKDMASVDQQAADALMEQATAWLENARAIAAKHGRMRQYGFVEITDEEPKERESNG